MYVIWLKLKLHFIVNLVSFARTWTLNTRPYTYPNSMYHFFSSFSSSLFRMECMFLCKWSYIVHILHIYRCEFIARCSVRFLLFLFPFFNSIISISNAFYIQMYPLRTIEMQVVVFLKFCIQWHLKNCQSKSCMTCGKVTTYCKFTVTNEIFSKWIWKSLKTMKVCKIWDNQFFYGESGTEWERVVIYVSEMCTYTKYTEYPHPNWRRPWALSIPDKKSFVCHVLPFLNFFIRKRNFPS